MVVIAFWTSLLASTACVSAYAVRNVYPDSADGIACGNSARSIKPASQAGGRTSTEYPTHTNDSSVPLPINVYLHVLSADGTEEGGNIRNATLDAKMQILNDAFKPTGFTFNVVETIHTVNEDWYYNLKVASKVEDEVSLALRKGDNATLNVYWMGDLNTINPGWATEPNALSYRAPYDGVFINGTTLPGGSHPLFRKGVTLVHEVGHESGWFGLLHTFGNGCEESYDFVDDTPIEDLILESGGCPIGRDTCPDQPGIDLIHNYMSLTDDACRNSWTPGQIQRMREQVAKYRGVVYPGIDVDKIPEDSYDN